MKLLCTEYLYRQFYNGLPEIMFSIGKEYQVVENKKHTLTVLDNKNRSRVISKDSLSFMVRNNSCLTVSGGYYVPPLYAVFKIAGQ